MEYGLRYNGLNNIPIREMKGYRELFEPIDIKAVKGKRTSVIGYITDKKRYTRRGGCIVPREVCFHYGTEHSDFFYFEDMSMVYQAVTIKTPEYLTDAYSECTRMKAISPEEFIERVINAFVMN